MTTSTGLHRRRALAGLIAGTTMLAMLPGSVSAAAFAGIVNDKDQSRWSWPGMAQTFVAPGGALTHVGLTLNRASTDTGTYRVEVRSTSSGAPTGHQVASTGIVIAAQTLSATTLSTDPSTPTTVDVAFDRPAVLTTSQTVAVVLLRGTNSGIAWHASSPTGPDQYPDGTGFFCVVGACWTNATSLGPVDFMLSYEGDGALMGSTPRASVVAPSSPTRASAFGYKVRFDKPVSGLTASDFAKSGSATGCTIGAPVADGSRTTWTVPLSGCSHGTLGLTLRAHSVLSDDTSPVSGPAAPVPAAATLTIDRTKPANGKPAAGLATKSTLLGSKLPVRTSWSTGTDGGGAGVWKYEVAKTTDGGLHWTSLGTTQKRSLDAYASPSGTLQFRLRAIDWAGNRGAWVKGPLQTPRLVQQTSSNVTFSSGWTTLVSAAFSGGSAKQSDDNGQWARYVFTGRAIAVIMSADPSLGVVKVYVDGTLRATVDVATFTPGDRVVVYQRRFASVGSHTIRVVSANGTRPEVILDAFARL
ncbi:MAG TPA: hypothetical protein VGK16_10030 [Candidatus Limnocylindrales bacterium]